MNVFFPSLFSCRLVAIILESYFRCDRSMLCIGLFDFVICWCFSVYNFSVHVCLVVSSLTIQILQTRLNFLSTDLIFRKWMQWLWTMFTPAMKYRTGNGRHAYAIDQPEPLVHFALCSGAYSDPAV